MDTDTESAARPREGKRKASDDRPTLLLDLPDDVLGHVATFLPLSDQLSFLSTHPQILSLARTHLNPLPSAIHDLVDNGPPYSRLLAKLPSLSLYLPEDAGHIFLEVLVRARPRWILERLELGRWSEAVWKEAFERRFLPSWRRFKGEDDSWRAIFLRTLSRVEHRNLGCTHEESWTRFVTLHRNGSGSINRMYSRFFDPYDIFDELKSQNDLASQPTQVRVIVHLQDVRVLALGVLINTPSLFVNPNAHLLLHPPLLRQLQPTSDGVLEVDETDHTMDDVLRNESHHTTGPSSGASTNSGGTPAVTDQPPNMPSMDANGVSATPSSPLKGAFASLLPGRIRRSGSSGQRETSPSRLGSVLTLVRSRDRDGGSVVRIRSRDGDEGRRRAWSLSRTRSRTEGVGELPSIVPALVAAASSAPVMPPVPERSADPSPSPRPGPSSSRASSRLGPYAPLTRPQPNSSHRLYPNYTPAPFLNEDPTLFLDTQAPPAADTRHRHEEVEDDVMGIIWSAGEARWGGDGTRMAEIDSRDGQRCRWVGPMILVAQLHPCDRTAAHPSGSVSTYGSIEGTVVDLGPKGMYGSLGFEDLEVLAPWVELRGGGGNSTEAKRDFLA